MESSHPETLQLLLKDDTIRGARVISTGQADTGMKTFGITPARPALPEVPAQTKDITANGSTTRQSDADLFTSVVGVEAGKQVLPKYSDFSDVDDQMNSRKRTKRSTASK